MCLLFLVHLRAEAVLPFPAPSSVHVVQNNLVPAAVGCFSEVEMSCLPVVCLSVCGKVWLMVVRTPFHRQTDR